MLLVLWVFFYSKSLALLQKNVEQRLQSTAQKSEIEWEIWSTKEISAKSLAHIYVRSTKGYFYRKIQQNRVEGGYNKLKDKPSTRI